MGCEEKKKVYLAGPMSGCNEAQMRDWRRELKASFGDEFEFVDPTERLIGPEQTHYELVREDLLAIENCDGVLANMWRESVGTAIGVFHANRKGKPVVVVDPNRIQNRILTFYSDATAHTVQAGLNQLRTLFRSEKVIAGVSKSDGTREEFSREKLSQSVQRAAAAAGRSDVLAPREIVPKALDALVERHNGEPYVVTTTEIRDAVWDALAELESDPLREVDFGGIRAAWEAFDAGETLNGTKMAKPATDEAVIHATPADIPVASEGTHSTIWGKGTRLHDLPSEARPMFQCMCRVDGIVGIVFREFKGQPGRPARPYVKLFASKTPGVIAGNYYGPGVKGTLQTFQIKVGRSEATEAVLRTLKRLLYREGYMRSPDEG